MNRRDRRRARAPGGPEALAAALEQGYRHMRGGRPQQAAACARRILARVPDQPDARRLLGFARLDTGRPADALELLLPLAGDREGDEWLHYAVASAYDALGRRADAAASYERALAAAPDHLAAWVGLGGCRMETGDPCGAVEAYRRALALAPGASPEATEIRLALAGAERDAGQLDAAVADYEAVLARDPGRRDAAHDLAVAEAERGDVGRALDRFRAILAAEPLDPAALHEWVGLGGAADEPEAWLARVEEAIAATGLDDRGRVLLHYATGRLYDRLGRTDDAFEHWRAANDLQAAAEPFDAQAFAARVDGLIGTFTPALFERLQGLGDAQARPIFVVGLPRSGTTLVEQILASHPEIHGAGERPDMGRIVLDLPAECGGGDYPGCVARLTSEASRRLGARYLDAVRPPDGPTRTADKLPSNFLRLGVVALLFPNARIVDCTRDPLDIGLSCYAQNFTAPQPFSHRLDSIAAYVAGKERLMRHWRDALPLPVHTLSYEALVGDLEGETRALLEFCGLPWDARCLHFHATARPVQTASLTQVRRPIYASSVGRWRRYADRLAPLGEALADAGLGPWPR